MKTTLSIEVDVNYPTIEHVEQRHTIERGETKTAIDLVISELNECFRIHTKKEFETIGAAKVKYEYNCLKDNQEAWGDIIAAGMRKGMTPIEVLRKYKTARDKLLEMVPEFKGELNV